MPVDKDVFAFRLRQSDDFACSVNWNQKTALSQMREIESVRCDRAQGADAVRSSGGDAHVRSRDNSRRYRMLIGWMDDAPGRRRN